MATLTLRRFKKYFVIVAPDNKIVKFKTRREAKDWCLQHYRGSPVSEVGADGSSQLTVRKGRP